ncbi:MAG: hypothetical protein H0X33_09315 [Taibaiella sp.]|nr:hypothetical protein [Taibaiella sp.]
MPNEEVVKAIRAFLQKQYMPFIKAKSIDRLVMTDRKELILNIPNVTTEQLEEVLKEMDNAGYITDDNGILITFRLLFIL